MRGDFSGSRIGILRVVGETPLHKGGRVVAPDGYREVGITDLLKGELDRAVRRDRPEQISVNVFSRIWRRRHGELIAFRPSSSHKPAGQGAVFLPKGIRIENVFHVEV